MDQYTLSKQELTDIIDAACQALLRSLLTLLELPEQDRTPETALQILKRNADIAETDTEMSAYEKAAYFRLCQLFATAL